MPKPKRQQWKPIDTKQFFELKVQPHQNDLFCQCDNSFHILFENELYCPDCMKKIEPPTKYKCKKSTENVAVVSHNEQETYQQTYEYKRHEREKNTLFSQWKNKRKALNF